MAEQQPEIPTFTRLIKAGTIQVARDGQFVAVVISEVHEGDENPLAHEVIPVGWEMAKYLGMQMYLAACEIELENKGREEPTDG